MDLVPHDDESPYRKGPYRKGSVVTLATPAEPHNKAVSCYSYDTYIDSEFSLSLNDDVLDLSDFKKTTKFVDKVPSPSLKITGTIPPRGVNYKLSTYGCRKFLSSVINAVQKNMKCGRCFTQYNSSNIVATRAGRAKFKRVKMLAAGSDAKRLVYQCTGQFIQDQFVDVANTPEDIQHLISLIRDKPQKEMLFPVHPSLNLGDDKPWCFNKMFEYVKYKVNKTQRELILMKLPYLTNWRSIVHKSEVLLEAFNHPNADYTRLPDRVNGVLTTPFQKMLHEAEKLIDFVRNANAHRMQRSISLTPAEHQRIIDVFFPKLAPELQEAIYDEVGKDAFEEYFLKVEN